MIASILKTAPYLKGLDFSIAMDDDNLLNPIALFQGNVSFLHSLK